MFFLCTIKGRITLMKFHKVLEMAEDILITFCSIFLFRGVQTG